MVATDVYTSPDMMLTEKDSDYDITIRREVLSSIFKSELEYHLYSAMAVVVKDIVSCYQQYINGITDNQVVIAENTLFSMFMGNIKENFDYIFSIYAYEPLGGQITPKNSIEIGFAIATSLYNVTSKFIYERRFSYDMNNVNITNFYNATFNIFKGINMIVAEILRFAFNRILEMYGPAGDCIRPIEFEE